MRIITDAKPPVNHKPFQPGLQARDRKPYILIN